MNEIRNDTTAGALRVLLLRLARGLDDLAASEAADTAYWEPCPTSVIGRRTAAKLLRDEAERIVESGRVA